MIGLEEKSTGLYPSRGWTLKLPILHLLPLVTSALVVIIKQLNRGFVCHERCKENYDAWASDDDLISPTLATQQRGTKKPLTAVSSRICIYCRLPPPKGAWTQSAWNQPSRRGLVNILRVLFTGFCCRSPSTEREYDGFELFTGTSISTSPDSLSSSRLQLPLPPKFWRQVISFAHEILWTL